MKRNLPALLLAVLGAVAAAAYLLLLLLRRFVSLPFELAPNVLARDWAFLAIPILGFLMGIVLQIAAIRKK